MSEVILVARNLKIVETADGEKYLADAEVGIDSDTEEQRRIAALEERITMLESALAGAQAQMVLKEAIIGNADIEAGRLKPDSFSYNRGIMQLAIQIINRSLENDRLLFQTKKKPAI